MTDDVSSKVISIFQRHRHGEHPHPELEEGGELVVSPDGFNYVSFKYDQNGHQQEDLSWETAYKKHYVVKMIEMHHHDSEWMRLNSYEVPGDRLEEFLLALSHRPGKILEIKQYIPDHMA